MIEKGNINLGLVASIVIGLLIGWLVITMLSRIKRPAPAAERPAPKASEPIGFKADKEATNEPPEPAKPDDDHE
ncbi:hypothetical protein [Fibrella forsythiae]|uniref:Uncharacterized protein n=1 Tax=Fibrella forsythiae TaxID=2817061 RepID=A0ABS3JAH9_9BACT|nr:hypothetical protein [Fibrella forsythiae]MBO0946991.1 hypothetical protein [Fibrella forsythiae]